ncbi:2265_t:CDS:2, partial [Entrophospora sp. SA101]
QKILFPEYEIITEPEEIDNVEEKNLSYLSLLPKKDSSEEFDDIYENSKVKVDKAFLKFQKRIQLYSRLHEDDKNPDPLWVSDNDKPGENNIIIPKCSNCGQERTFEFQVLSTLLNYLKIDHTKLDSLDWGTLLIYSCKDSCHSENNYYLEEFIYRQDFSNDGQITKKVKYDVAEVLSKYKPSNDCHLNSFALGPFELSDDILFTAIDDCFPFVGREKEMKMLEICIIDNIKIWNRLHNHHPNFCHTDALESFKRLYQTLVVAGAPGIGKTTFIQRALDHTERMLINQYYTESVIVLRILHQSINGREYHLFLNDLEYYLESYGLHLKDINLKTVLDHVLHEKSDHNQLLTMFHITETNIFFQNDEGRLLEAITNSIYNFNKSQGTHFLFTCYDGTHRDDLYMSFGSSGPSMLPIILSNPSINNFIEILQYLANKVSTTQFYISDQCKYALEDLGSFRLFSLFVYNMAFMEVVMKPLSKLSADDFLVILAYIVNDFQVQEDMSIGNTTFGNLEKDDGTILDYLHTLFWDGLPSSSHSNERSDLAMMTLKLLLFKAKRRRTFYLTEIFPGLKGQVGKMALLVPENLSNPTVLHEWYKGKKHIGEEMIIGCGSDPLPDSWFSFKKEDGSGVIRVYFESKKNVKITKSCDYDISSIEADDDEYIIGTNNM